jgi:hypothetical protein
VSEGVHFFPLEVGGWTPKVEWAFFIHCTSLAVDYFYDVRGTMECYYLLRCGLSACSLGGNFGYVVSLPTAFLCKIEITDCSSSTN